MKLWIHSLYILVIGFLVAFIITRPPEAKLIQGGEHERVARALVENDIESAANQGSLNSDSDSSPARTKKEYSFEAVDEAAEDPYSSKENIDSKDRAADELIDEVIHQRQEEEIHAKIDQLDSQFEREPIDQSWALEQEQNINDLFVINEELRDLEVDSVQCRQSLCRVRLDSGDADSLSTMMKIQKSITQEDWYVEDSKTYLRNSDANGYNFTLYTER